MTTPKRSRKSGAATPKPRRSTTATRARKPKAVDPEPVAVPRDDPPAVLEAVAEPIETVIVTGAPEPAFAAYVPPPEPPPVRPAHRRGVFFDVENTSRAADIARVLRHLALDWEGWGTQFTAVGNWRVIGHDTARLLAQQGAALVHSAPSVGVRDWSDLRIAVSAGVWLAGARPGDVIEIVSDDQAFDAVGDVAASLGVIFRRTSYRALAGGHEAAAPASSEPRAWRGRRSGRRGRGGERGGRRAPEPARVAATAPASEEPHTAPHDEIVGVVRELLVSGLASADAGNARGTTLCRTGSSRAASAARIANVRHGGCRLRSHYAE